MVSVVEVRGAKLRSRLEQVTKEAGMAEHVLFLGRPSCLMFMTNHTGQPSHAFRTLFIQELLRREVLEQSLVTSAAHTEADIEHAIDTAAGAVEVYARAVEAGSTTGLLVGRPVAPVIREFAEPRRLWPADTPGRKGSL
jgi:glutamate-1-semialdehyde 2,1-aminomutase